MEYAYEAFLSMSPGIGAVKYQRVIQYFKSAENAWTASLADWGAAKCISSNEIVKFADFRKQLDTCSLISSWEKSKIRVCIPQDECYPDLLRNIFDPPPVLFYRGELSGASKFISIVGSRRTTPYGRNAATLFGEKLAQAGLNVVSGAARGIDTEAHKGALIHGKTTAVLGCGVDVAYPPENANLLAAIAENGAVVSEYAPGTKPVAGQFPARNRIIAGMSSAVLIVEASEKSGALITADFALNENRDVFAIPGSIFSDFSKGSNRLIQQGAKLIGCVKDILDEMGIDAEPIQNQVPDTVCSEDLQVVDSLAKDSYTTLDEVAAMTKLPLPQIQMSLLRLELSGLLIHSSAQGYLISTKE